MLKALLAIAATSFAGGGQPSFEGHSEPIRGQIEERIEGSSWHPGCPVGLGKLRLLELTHWGFDGDVHRGRLVVHRREADGVLAAMKRLFHLRYPIRRMELIDRYGADDHRSMNADNTSAFNCRFVAGTSRWSMHAYGRAIDVNPIENPYVSGSHVSPPAGAPYADRSRNAEGHDPRRRRGRRGVREEGRLGMGRLLAGGARDYQHFSSNGT